MNWILSSVLLYISSVVLYLVIRKSQLKNIPSSMANLGMFFIPAFIFFGLIIYFHISFLISVFHLFLIILAAFFFSYLGNVSSLIAIKNAPNPGYSLIISKSYVILTSVLSIFLFNSKLTLLNIIAIICIIIFSGVIMIGKKNPNQSTKQWIAYSFGAFFCWAFLALFSKYILNQGISVFVYLFYLSCFASLFVGIEMMVRKQKVHISKETGWILLMIGLSSALFNLFMQLGYKTAPNPGFINAVNASSISLLTILSAYIYKDDLTKRKVIGVIGVTIGLILLFIG